MPSIEPIVRARGLVKRYGEVVALAGVDVDVPRGITGLLGPNGAGKTTFIGMLLGLARPDSGSIEVSGIDPAARGPEVRARVGYSPEHHLLPPDMAAVDLVRHLAEVHGIPRSAATSRASDALWYVGMGEERQRPLGTMSTGQRQRVKLAMALSHDPALLLLDEPTDGLDPHQRETMLELIVKVARETGIDVIMSSHLLDEVERTCDQVVIIVEGKVRAAGSNDDLRGSGSGMLVEVAGEAGAFVERLRARGLSVEVDGRRLRIEPTAATVDLPLDVVVRDDLAATGTPLRRLARGTASLADVYVRSGA